MMFCFIFLGLTVTPGCLCPSPALCSTAISLRTLRISSDVMLQLCSAQNGAGRRNEKLVTSLWEKHTLQVGPASSWRCRQGSCYFSLGCLLFSVLQMIFSHCFLDPECCIYYKSQNFFWGKPACTPSRGMV